MAPQGYRIKPREECVRYLLVAIAFVTALSHGLHPGAYIFEQNLMCSHLLKCFENGKLSMFPVRKTRRVAEKVKRLKNSMCFAPAGYQ